MSQLTLEILIRTIAENRGLEVTNEQVKELAQNLEEAAKAGKQLDVSSDSIEKALRDQQKAASDAASEWEKMSEAQKQSIRDQAQEALRMMDSTEAKKKAADATRGLGRELGALRQAGRGVGDVMRGLSRGDLPGLAQAAKGLYDIFRGLGSGFQQLRNALGVGAAITGPALVAIHALNQAAKENEAAIKKMVDANNESLERYAQRSKQLTEQVVADQAKQREAIAETARAYDTLLERMDAAEGRSKALNQANLDRAYAKLDADEASALAQARTPEERERIKREFGIQRSELKGRGEVDDIENQVLRAGVRERAANSTITEAIRRRDEISAGERELQAALDAAVAAAGAERVGSDGQRKAQAEAKAARDALQKFREGSKGDLEAIDATIRQAQGEIDSARNVRELANVQRDTTRYRTEAQVTNLSRPSDDLQAGLKGAGDRVSSIEAQIAAERDRAFRGGFGETADTAALERELATARSAEAEANRAILEDAKLRKKESDALKAQIKANKENTTGGG